MTRMLVTGLAVLMLVGTGLAQENPDPRDEEIRARAHQMLEEALLKAKEHDLEGAHALLLQIIEWAPTDESALKARLEIAKMLVRMGKTEEAVKALQGYVDRHGKLRVIPWTKYPALAEKAKHWRAVLEADLEARKLRRRAMEARIEAREMEAKAEIAEARARLMGEDVAPEEIEKHLKELHERATHELKALLDDLEKFDRGGPPHHARKAEPDQPFFRGDARVRHDEGRSQFEALWRLLHQRGFTEEEAKAEAKLWLAERKEAHRSFEDARKHLLELGKLVEGREPDVKKLADLAREMYERSLRHKERPNRFHQLLTELTAAVRENRQDDVRRINEEFEKLVRSGRRADGPAPRRDSIEERVDRIEKQLDEMRALLEEALRRK